MNNIDNIAESNDWFKDNDYFKKNFEYFNELQFKQIETIYYKFAIPGIESSNIIQDLNQTSDILRELKDQMRNLLEEKNKFQHFTRIFNLMLDSDVVRRLKDGIPKEVKDTYSLSVNVWQNLELSGQNTLIENDQYWKVFLIEQMQDILKGGALRAEGDSSDIEKLNNNYESLEIEKKHILKTLGYVRQHIFVQLLEMIQQHIEDLGREFLGKGKEKIRFSNATTKDISLIFYYLIDTLEPKKNLEQSELAKLLGDNFLSAGAIRPDQSSTFEKEISQIKNQSEELEVKHYESAMDKLDIILKKLRSDRNKKK